MPTAKLTQALIAQKVSNAESTVFEVISRALEVPEDQLKRILFAVTQLNMNPAYFNWEVLLPDRELREAIEKAVTDGRRRMIIATAIQNGSTLTVNTCELLPQANAHKLCNGCPERLECIAEKLYTPIQCYTERKTKLTVFPLRMTATELEVEASQPAGKHTIHLKHISTT